METANTDYRSLGEALVSFSADYDYIIILSTFHPSPRLGRRHLNLALFTMTSMVIYYRSELFVVFVKNLKIARPIGGDCFLLILDKRRPHSVFSV